MSAQNNADMLSLMQGLGVADPKILQLAQLLQQQNVEETDTGPDGPNHSEPDPTYEALLEENLWLNKRLTMFASALGACRDCLGENTACPYCQGKGAPGRYRPDKGLFAELVLPVVELLNSQIRGRRKQAGHIANALGTAETIE